MRASNLLRLRVVSQSSFEAADEVREVSKITTMRTNSPKIRRLLWIMTFCKEEPALKRLVFWAQGKGAIAHPSLFVRYEEDDGAGYRLLVDRPVKKGTTLLSIPLPQRVRRSTEMLLDEAELHPAERVEFDHESTAVIQPEVGSVFSGTAVENPVTQLVHNISRGLTDEAHPQYDYLRFLHDRHNPPPEGGVSSSSSPQEEFDEEDESIAALTSSSSIAELENFQPPPMPELDEFAYVDLSRKSKMAEKDVAYHRDLNAEARHEMQQLIDAHTGHTAMIIKGAANAPYLTVEHFETKRGKAELVRLKRYVRNLQQSLPFFNASAVPWALSMIMSRAIMLPEVPYSLSRGLVRAGVPPSSSASAKGGSTFINRNTHPTTKGLCRVQEVFVPHGPTDHTSVTRHIASAKKASSSSSTLLGNEETLSLPTFALREKAVSQLFTYFTSVSAVSTSAPALASAPIRKVESDSKWVKDGNQVNAVDGRDVVGQRVNDDTPIRMVLSKTIEVSRPALVPLLDFCNHSAAPSAHYCVTIPSREDEKRHKEAVGLRKARLSFFRREKRERRAMRRRTEEIAARKEGDGSKKIGPHSARGATAADRALSALGHSKKAPSTKSNAGGSDQKKSSAPSRMLTPVVGVRGWHYWRPCVHLVAIKDLEKFEEVTLKYAEDAPLMMHQASVAGASQAMEEEAYCASDRNAKVISDAAETVRDGFVFRYGFRPTSRPNNARFGSGSRRRGLQRTSDPPQPRTLTDVAGELEDLLLAGMPNL